MPRQTKSEGQKALDQFLKAAKKAPKETPEQKAEREKKRAIQEGAGNLWFPGLYTHITACTFSEMRWIDAVV